MLGNLYEVSKKSQSYDIINATFIRVVKIDMKYFTSTIPNQYSYLK